MIDKIVDFMFLVVISCATALFAAVTYKVVWDLLFK